MASHLEVTFPSVFLCSLTTYAHVEKNFKRKGSLPGDLIQSCLGTSTWNSPLHSSRLHTLAQVGDPRRGRSKKEMHLCTVDPRSVPPKQAGIMSPISTAVLSKTWNIGSTETVDLGRILGILARWSVRGIPFIKALGSRILYPGFESRLYHHCVNSSKLCSISVLSSWLSKTGICIMNC